MATVGSFLFDYLRSKGVSHVFGIPGDFALPTFRHLQQSGLGIVTMTHEPSVGFAADGYARVQGSIGVACVTYCVGGLNMLNSVACAYAEKSPVLVISGGPSPADRKGDALIHHKVRTFDTQRRIYEDQIKRSLSGSILTRSFSPAHDLLGRPRSLSTARRKSDPQE